MFLAKIVNTTKVKSIMTGVVREKTGEKPKFIKETRYGARVSIFHEGKFFLSLGLLVVISILFQVDIVSGQAYRRPLRTRPSNVGSVPSGIDAYRNRWMEYYKNRSSSTTKRPLPSLPILRGGDSKNTLVVNGFSCERTYGFFPNKNDPRMYHLCAKRRDSWFVYHYFCPRGTTFHDGVKKCLHDQNSAPSIFGNAASRTTTMRPTSTTTPPSPPSSTHPTTVPTTTLRSTTIISSSSTQEPVPEAEPGVTESSMYSSEESSTEDEMPTNLKDVVVSLPGFVMSPPSPSSDSDEVEEVTPEKDASDEVNMIPESANKVPQPPTLSRLPSQVQTKKMKTSTIESSKTKLASGNEPSTAAGGRRPRLLEKWRSQFGKYW